jgi:hypothetical protein
METGYISRAMELILEGDGTLIQTNKLKPMIPLGSISPIGLRATQIHGDKKFV